MSEEEKIFDIFVKECNELVKDKGLKETIEELRNQNAELRDELEVKNKSYDKLLDKYNKLVCCHLQYEEMMGVDLLLPDKVDVISKDKIKAKIEEYKVRGYEEASGALQELLEEEE